MHACYTRGYSHIAITAALSLAVLVVVVGWVWGEDLREKRAALSATMQHDTENRVPLETNAWKEELIRAGIIATTSPEALAASTSRSLTEEVFNDLIGAYVSLKQGNSYTPELADTIAKNIANNSQVMVTFAPIEAKDVKTDSDTSYERMLAYREDLRIATEPLLLNTEAEFSVYARYVETKNEVYLEELRTIAARYRESASLAAKVVAPKDAVVWHVSIVNSLNEFGAVLDAMGRFANDPIASIALLRAYNTAERHLVIAFDSLSTYYDTKQP